MHSGNNSKKREKIGEKRKLQRISNNPTITHIIISTHICCIYAHIIYIFVQTNYSWMIVHREHWDVCWIFFSTVLISLVQRRIECEYWTNNLPVPDRQSRKWKRFVLLVAFILFLLFLSFLIIIADITCVWCTPRASQNARGRVMWTLISIPPQYAHANEWHSSSHTVYPINQRVFVLFY